VGLIKNEEMSKEELHSNYSAKDIERYLLGKMPNEEMYALEKAALDDPLLAEAIEGFEGMEEKNWEKVIVDLRSILTAVENTAIVKIDKNSFAKWWRVAAALLLLLSSVAIAYIFTIDKAPLTLADVKSNDKNITIDSVAVISSKLPNNDTSTEPAVQSATKSLQSLTEPRTEKSITPFAPIKNTTNKNFEYLPNQNLSAGKNGVITTTDENYFNPTTANGNEVNRFSHTNKNIDEKTTVTEATQQNSLNEISINNAKESNTKNDSYNNGQIDRLDDNATPFAQENIEANKKQSFADGKSNTKNTDEDSSMPEIVNVVGYGAKKITNQTLQGLQKIKIKEANDRLKNIKASEDNIDKKVDASRINVQDELKEQASEDAEPIIGWAEYNKYLWNNVTQNKEIADKQVHGIVDVFIKLNKEGLITKIKITKSLCPECDALAVRLIKEGSKWKVKYNKAKNITIKVRF